MEKMADMKLSKRDKRRMFGSPVTNGVAGSGPDYPWGLSITLDAAALKKLGVEDLPDAGDECQITATGKVTRVTQSASDKRTDRSVEIQITKLALAVEDDDDAAWNKVKADRKAAG